ncbi:N-acetylmuramoyl-L-alanine amidase family protein [Desulforamulus ferrireducens]|uniref:Cell wall hydrolase n=1 Tax=Desulforamulus ferrireducens TaxID=1833852 RepID=A0A1S6IVX5_9FIRM|nr:N-acetylmuramoyl-L-alanine amidase [Desulforamulus ferrireducens]AQS58916.1 cell wall hydrolase [Desulforamulus ferrireducens]
MYLLWRVLLIVVILACPRLGWAEESLGRIVIDPGHGGYDPGAMRKGITEKQINLEIAQEIKKILVENNVEVLLTREGDYNHAIIGLHGKEAKKYDFERRIQMAKSFNADAMISIHVNVGRQKCSGPEAFYYPKSAPGKLLAQKIQEQLHQIPNINRRQVKTGRYYLLTHTDMPCVIVETGFIDNPEERERLLEPRYRQMLAAAIAQGIIEYLQTKDEEPQDNVS